MQKLITWQTKPIKFFHKLNDSEPRAYSRHFNEISAKMNRN